MSFAETLHRLRDAAGMSQMDLARKSGISIDSLRNWEQGRALPRVDAAVKLAAALGVSVDKLVEDIEGGAREPKASKKGQKRKEQR